MTREREMKKESMYVLYDGDEVIGIGTARELAKQRGVTVNTIRRYATPSYHKRCVRIQAERVEL